MAIQNEVFLAMMVSEEKSMGAHMFEIHVIIGEVGDTIKHQKLFLLQNKKISKLSISRATVCGG